jgi:DNA-binding PadR family transcriptional regulator
MCHSHDPVRHEHFYYSEPGSPFGHRRRHRHGGWSRRARRGDIRAAILAVLAEQPMHGYQIIQELESRSDGVWRPSAGSVYPTLQLLEDEGLIRREETEGKRVYSVTDEGRAGAEAAQAQPPWEAVAKGGNATAVRLRRAAFQVGAAAMQAAHAGSEEQATKAVEVLADARRRIYAILAENGDAEGAA